MLLTRVGNCVFKNEDVKNVKSEIPASTKWRSKVCVLSGRLLTCKHLSASRNLDQMP